ncbi:hypothetical protein [Sphingomonas sp. G-3-2-10]|uniref:hypothetical protein n=1 Tax=Sphingomonas sp. G-3-2-10 TaxID=2728838 RepID=UPI0019D1432C|nr:hypothetical protein [Sphingomonas sp. G-3-2-10]
MTDPKPIVVSLFDESGNMGRPWAINGSAVHCFDIQNDGRVETFPSGGTITYHPADLTDPVYLKSVVNHRPAIVFGFPPCTDLALSGSRHFAAKRAADPDFQINAVKLARTVEQVGNEAGCPWFAENPKSRLSSLWRKPDYTFDPSDFGGYLPDDDVHPRWPEYIAPRDAYPKETWLWTGNGFRLPPRKPVTLPAGYSVQFKKLGGKSEKTKQIRSETPRGFAQAVFELYGQAQAANDYDWLDWGKAA